MKLKYLWPYARTGLLIGMAIQLAMLWIDPADHRIATEMTVWLIASVIYGVSSMLFSVERLSLLAATVLIFSWPMLSRCCAASTWATAQPCRRQPWIACRCL